MKTEAPPAIRQTAAHLLNSRQRLLNRSLSELSDLRPAELAYLEEVWPQIALKRRRQIAARLVELAEDDVQLSFDAIFKMPLTDPDEEVRTLAIGGLWENEEPSLIEPLIGLLQEDSTAKVRAATAAALGRFALLAEHGRLRPEAADRVRQAMLAAIQALGKIGGGRARKCLERLLGHPRESVRQVAREAIATLDEMAGPLSFGFDEVV